jgi:hypothetical protein
MIVMPVRASPASTPAGVDVEAAQARQVEHPLRQDQAVGRDHHHVGTRREQGLARGGGLVGVLAVQPQAARLRHGPALGQRALLDRRGLQLHAAAGRAIGLGQHQHHVVAGGRDGLQRDARELGRARKNNAQRAHRRSRSKSRSSPVW